MKQSGFLRAALILGFVLLLIPPQFLWSQGAEETNQKIIVVAQEGQTKPPHMEQKQTEKESFQKEANKIIQDLDKKIGALNKKVKKEGTKIKAEAKESWESLKAKQIVAKKKLKDLSASGDEAWDKLKSEANKAMEEARKAYDKAVSYFK